MIETIRADGEKLALIVRAGAFGDETNFVTAEEHPLQLGLLSYEAGESADAHTHPDVDRTVTRSQEVIHVKTGRIHLDVYDDGGDHRAERELEAGDSAFFVSGGRGWTAETDAEVIEVKQGPYLGAEDKVLVE